MMRDPYFATLPRVETEVYSREWAGQLACRKVIDLLTLMIEYTNEGEAALLI